MCRKRTVGRQDKAQDVISVVSSVESALEHSRILGPGRVFRRRGGLGLEMVQPRVQVVAQRQNEGLPSLRCHGRAVLQLPVVAYNRMDQLAGQSLEAAIFTISLSRILLLRYVVRADRIGIRRRNHRSNRFSPFLYQQKRRRNQHIPVDTL